MLPAVFHGCVVDAMIEARDIALIRRLAMCQVDYRGCAPAHVAAMVGDVDALKTLLSSLPDPNIVNRGAPLRVAIERGHDDCVRALLEFPTTDVNRDGALFHAVHNDRYEAFALLLRHPKIAVNAFAPSRGTTALGQAVIRRSAGTLRDLLCHPRIDANRGFLFSPLQLAVMMDHREMVEALLAKAQVDPNFAVGSTEPPLQLALEHGNRQLTSILVGHHRTVVPMRMLAALERDDDVDTLQLLCDASKSLCVGDLWSQRYATLAGLVFVSACQLIVDFGLIIHTSSEGLARFAVAVVLVHIAAAVAGAAQLWSARVHGRFIAAHAIPLVPVFAVTCCIFVYHASSQASFDLLGRSRTFSIVQRVRYTVAAKAATALFIAIAHGGVTSFQGVTPWFVLFVIVHALELVVAVALHRLRLHGIPLPSYSRVA